MVVAPVPHSSLFLLLLNVRPKQSWLHTAPHLCVQQSTQKDHSCAQPVPESEGVLEVHDGEDEAEELPQSHHQGDSEWGALCCQDENTTDTDVPEETG